MPGTWASYSLDVFGYVADQTPENELYVTEQKIVRWLESGLTERDIFMIWNTGRTGQCSAGVNRWGVPYDSCAYVAKGLQILDDLMHKAEPVAVGG